MTYPSLVGGGGGGVTPRKIGGCGLLPKTLTLFVAKIFDFPYPIYDLTKDSILYSYDHNG